MGTVTFEVCFFTTLRPCGVSTTKAPRRMVVVRLEGEGEGEGEGEVEVEGEVERR